MDCHDGVQQMSDAYRAPDNEVFFANIDLMFGMGYNLWVGPVYWLEDYFHSDNVLEQRIGIAAKHRWVNPWFAYDASLKVGMDGASMAPRVLADVTIQLGSLGGY